MALLARARPLGPLMTNAIRYTLTFVAIVVVLREVGVDVQALLVSAGVLGLAVGLRAQSLIKDVITGFFDAAHRFAAEVELRRRILEAFEREGILFPQRVVYVQERTSP